MARAPELRLALSLLERRDERCRSRFPYFGGTLHERFPENDQGTETCCCARFP